jgi:glycosyltransferase involved in cell wall biosynthesis
MFGRRSKVAQVDIAMPTYNCAPWLDGVMASLLAQDFTDWRLIARDDKSTDDTGRQLAQWQDRLGSRMIILPDSGVRNLGLIGNYNAVLTATNARWVMSADPDDVWLAGKMTRSAQAIREAEAALGDGVPLAICTDAAVVDSNRQPVAPSFWGWSRMDPSLMQALARVAMESVALGSTMMMNRALLTRALPIETGAAYQDWWLALVAVAFGRLVTLPETTILYRRHEVNATADPYGSTLVGALRRTVHSPGAPRRRLEKLVLQAAKQARSFVTRYGDGLKRPDVAALEALGKLPSLGLVERRLAVLRYGLWFASPIKNAGLMALL